MSVDLSQILSETPIGLRLLMMLGMVSGVLNIIGWSCCAFAAWTKTRPRKRDKAGRFKSRKPPVITDLLNFTEDDCG